MSRSATAVDRAAKLLRLGLAGATVAVLAGCAPEPVARMSYSKGKEHFSQAKYGKASAKMVADGDPVPRGGGQYLVGRPYRVAGKTYVPAENPGYTVVGMASWYGAAFHGRRTSNGEIFDMASITAAHPTMPLPSYARVTNVSNGYSVIVRVNDRGPFSGGRVMDVSSRTADILGFKGAGTARIKVEYVGRAPMEGSDDNALLASLRTDGSAASLPGYSAPAETMIADAGASAFGALFSQARGAPQTAPPPSEPVVASPAPPQPEPEPTAQVAAVEPPTVSAAQAESAVAEKGDADDEAPVKPMRTAALMRGPVPMPPARPFDLGQIHETLVVAEAQEARAKVASTTLAAITPPRRPILQASAGKALYFAAPGGVARRTTHAFDRVKTPLSRND